MATGERLYEVIGVSAMADQATLKSAYRRLAKCCHPDLHPGDAVAEARFKEIAAAYEVLSDVERRADYDEFGEESLKKNLDRDFARFVREQQSRAPVPPVQARPNLDISADVSLTLRQAWSGAVWEGHVIWSFPCEPCRGTGAIERECGQCRGSGSVYRYFMVMCFTCLGGRFKLLAECRTCAGRGFIPQFIYPAERCQACNGSGRTQQECTACKGSGRSAERTKLSVTIPPRTPHGKVLRVRGRGLPNVSGEVGDVLMTIVIEK